MRHSILAFLLPFVFSGCGASSSPSGSSSSALTGPINLRLVDVSDVDDTSSPTVSQVVVTISRIDARIEDGRSDDDEDAWVTVLSAGETVDLLSLQGTTFSNLGIVNLPAAGLERLRLFVNPAGPNYVTTSDGTRHTLVLPADSAAGVRIVGDFDEEVCSTGHVTLDFAGKRSIVVETDPNGVDTWTLRPVIRLHEAITGCPEDSDHGGSGKSDHNDSAK